MLREAGIPVGFEIMGRKMTKALEDADRRKVDFVVIVGSRELRKGAVAVRDLASREQFTVKIAELPEKIKGQSNNGD